MARLDRLYSQDDDDDDGLLGVDGDGQRAKLFEWVLGVNHNLLSRLLSASTLKLIRDTGNVLCHRINTEGYEESQGDIQAVSEIVDDIRDALLDYQVCNDRLCVAGVQLNRETLIDGAAAGDIRPELQADCESNNLSTNGISNVNRGFQDTGSVLRCFPSNSTYLRITQRSYWC